MDRKGWIILLLAAVGLVVNFYYAAQRQPPPTAPTEERDPGDPAFVSPDSPPQVEDPAVEAPGVDDPIDTAPPPKVEFAEEIERLEWRGPDGEVQIVYHFTNVGGGISLVEFPQDPEHAYGGGLVSINAQSYFPIGALATGPGDIEHSQYQLVERGDDFIVYEGQGLLGLSVRKHYQIEEVEGSEKNLLRLEIELATDDDRAVQSDRLGLYLGSMMPLLADEFAGQTGYAWYADGSSDFTPSRRFDAGWFSSSSDLRRGTLDNVMWFGLLSQFYTTMVTPEDGASFSYWVAPIRGDVEGRREGEQQAKTGVQAGIGFGDVTLAGEGETLTRAYTFYLGPKNYDQLKKLGDERQEVLLYGDLAVFGWFASPFSRMLNWGMHRIHGVVGAYGIAIIILTLIIRVLIWPLHAKSMRTMKRMSLLGPKIKELKEKYPDDPQKMNQEMMKLYKDYGVNPFGGCLPLLLQMPIFFGFYRMLQYAAELRHEGFLWVQDLSQPDTVGYIFGIPINVLPLLMAASMILQMKLTPQTADKMQRRIFMFLPLIFLFICYNFASALSLYWTTQNIFSIGQTWWMRRQPEVELVKRKPRPKPAPPGAPQKKKKNRPPRTGG